MTTSNSLPKHTRRRIVKAGASIALFPAARLAANPLPAKMRYGLVTYNWGRDLSLPDLIDVCEQSGALGVELRTTHTHGVERSLTAAQRDEVRPRFADSLVTLVGLGSDERFDNPDPVKRRAAMDATRDFIRLSRDVGGSGVKVKPDSFHKGVPHEVTIAQIARALNELGPFAADHGQQIRMEMHGQCAPPPIIKSIMEQVTHPAIALCWNCNMQDVAGEGLEHNFNLVSDRLGATLHIHQWDHAVFKYPYEQLLGLLDRIDYEGWLLNETGGPIPPRAQRVAAIVRDRTFFESALATLKR